MSGEHARWGPPPAVPVGQGPEPVGPDRPCPGAGEPRLPAELREVACLRVEPVALLRGHLPGRRAYNLLQIIVLSFTSMVLLTPACWHHQRSGGGEARWPLFGDRNWSKSLDY